MNSDQRESIMSLFKKNWKSPFVARTHVGEFSGGLLHPRTMANLDSQKKGPSRRIRLGRSIAYPVDELLLWMTNNIEFL
ncbi:hypothetical protein ACTVJH_09545 [Desulfoplanes sp. PS50]